jgi:uncharacterized protein
MNDDSGGDEPRPRGIMHMRWLSLMFMHWPVSMEAVRQMRPAVPDGLEIDTFEGCAWVGLVPFTMRDVRPACTPSIPGVSHFHECNVRTYVTHGGEPGVWFFSLDAVSRLAVWGARRFFKLPYHLADMSLDRRGDEVRYRTVRRGDRGAHLRCAWRAGKPLPCARPGELAHFLTERYCLYASDERGGLFRGKISHQPWSLRTAELLELDDGLLQAAGLSLPSDAPPPLLHHMDDLRVWSRWIEGISAPKLI